MRRHMRASLGLFIGLLALAPACKQSATAPAHSTRTAVTPPARSGTPVSGAPAVASSERGTASPSVAAQVERVAAKRLAGKAVDAGLETLTGPPMEHWYGVYMAGSKVGHATMTWRPAKGDEPGAWAGITNVAMSVSGRGNRVEMRIDERRFYAGTSPYKLVATTMSQAMGGVTDERVARLEDGKLVIERTVDGRRQPGATLDSPKESLRDFAATAPRSLKGLKVGTKTSVTMFNWQLMKEEVMHIVVKKLSKLGQGGVVTHVATLDATLESMGLTMTSLVAEPGLIIETSMGPGLKMKLEEKAVAQGNITGLDVMWSGVAVDKKLGDPKGITKLELSVGVTGDFVFPRSAIQRVRKKGGRYHITVSAGPGDVVTPEDRRKALLSDSLIDAGNPAIKAKSKELLKGAVTDADKVRTLLKFVYGALEKRLATNLPTASKVLEDKVGDCTEHTWLFVALARAAGLPARPAYGLAYIGDDYTSFGYHAWVEVALDGKWLAIDPTWNEPVADATHLRLGEELYTIASVIGGLDIKLAGPVQR